MQKLCYWIIFNIEDEYSFDAILITALLKLTEDKMDKKLSENIKRALKDMNYVKEMKQLENFEGKADLHIVPVSGLIISRFQRCLNELVTVKEIWERKVQ